MSEYEEVCSECGNTNGEHVGHCSRTSRHDRQPEDGSSEGGSVGDGRGYVAGITKTEFPDGASQAGDSTLRKSCGNCATVRDDGQFCPKCGSGVFHWEEGDSTHPVSSEAEDIQMDISDERADPKLDALLRAFARILRLREALEEIAAEGNWSLGVDEIGKACMWCMDYEHTLACPVVIAREALKPEDTTDEHS